MQSNCVDRSIPLYSNFPTGNISGNYCTNANLSNVILCDSTNATLQTLYDSRFPHSTNSSLRFDFQTVAWIEFQGYTDNSAIFQAIEFLAAELYSSTGDHNDQLETDVPFPFFILFPLFFFVCVIFLS
jgi:hypothetical protein